MFSFFKKKPNLSRKERNEKFLETTGLKINYNLPHIETEEQTVLRTPLEIARRITVLAATNMVAFDGMTGERAEAYLEENDLLEFATPKELDFLRDPTASKKQNETWKAECIWVLMWAMNVVDELGFPDTMCDLNHIASENYPVEGYQNPLEFIAEQNSSRYKSEIMDMNDLYYRIHWACVDARINGRQMEIVNPGIVYERHYALNWLINYMEQEWDDITTDT